MKFVLSNSLFFAVAWTAIAAIPGRAEFDHEWAKIHVEDPAYSVTTPKYNKVEDDIDRKLSSFRGAAAPPNRLVPPRPLPTSPDSFSTATTTSGGRIEGGRVGGNQVASGSRPVNQNIADPQSFWVSMVPPEVAKCCDVKIEVKTVIDEPLMAFQVVAPNGKDKEVDLDKPKKEDVDYKEEGLKAGYPYAVRDECLNMMENCYIFIVRDPTQFGFINGYAKIIVNGEEVYTITGNSVWCGVGVQCGDEGDGIVGIGDMDYLVFNKPYEYAAIGSCAIN